MADSQTQFKEDVATKPIFEVGATVVWEPDLPHARCVSEIVEAKWNGEEWWYATEDILGGEAHWNDEGRMVEACVLYEDWKERPIGR